MNNARKIGLIFMYFVGSALLLAVIIFGFRSLISSNTDSKQLHQNLDIGKAVGTMENGNAPITLISVCIGEETQLVECTFIPEDESLRTPFEKALATQSEKE